jgi:hypothetical protein
MRRLHIPFNPPAVTDRTPLKPAIDLFGEPMAVFTVAGDEPARTVPLQFKAVFSFRPFGY